MSAITFVSDQPAAKVHSSLRRSLKAMEKAQQCSVLWFAEVMMRHLYRELGYSSINQYAKKSLVVPLKLCFGEGFRTDCMTSDYIIFGRWMTLRSTLSGHDFEVLVHMARIFAEPLADTMSIRDNRWEHLNNRRPYAAFLLCQVSNTPLIR